MALVAYLRHHVTTTTTTDAAGGAGASDDKGAGETAPTQKLHFCFLNREDARAMLGHDGANRHNGHDRDGEKATQQEGEGGQEDAEARGGLLREIRVSSEIGRQEDGKQVLKNVGKVEKFVLEQVRRIFEEEFVWPSFWTFLV